MMNSKTNRSDGSKASVVRFAMLPSPEPLSEPRRGEFRRRAANRRANRIGNAACQEIVFESSWRYIFYKIISMAFIFTFTQTSATTFYLAF